MPNSGQLLLKKLVKAGPESNLPLDEGACAIALPHRPDLRIEVVRERLDRLAKEALDGTKEVGDPSSLLQSVRATLFEKHGFMGNEVDYYAPENSFIDAVLEKRVGIPITLSVVYMEVARRVGVSLFGLALPCHFMVGWSHKGSLRVFDPYHGGVERSVGESIELVHLMSGGRVTIGRDHFRPASHRNVLNRMLLNLRGIYRDREDSKALVPVLDQLLILGAGDRSIHGELALHLANCGDLVRAHDHLKKYIAAVGGLTDEEEGSEWVQRIRTQFSAYN